MKRSLIFGLFCLPAGLIAIAMIFGNNNDYDPGWWRFQFSIVAASILIPAFLWYLIIERKKRFSMKRGIVVGVLSVFLSHYFSWFFWLYIGPLLEQRPEILDGGVDPLLFSMKASLTYSTVSLLLFGLLHLPLGGLIGGSYANYIKKTKQKTLLKRATDILKVI